MHVTNCACTIHLCLLDILGTWSCSWQVCLTVLSAGAGQTISLEVRGPPGLERGQVVDLRSHLIYRSRMWGIEACDHSSQRVSSSSTHTNGYSDRRWALWDCCTKQAAPKRCCQVDRVVTTYLKGISAQSSAMQLDARRADFVSCHCATRLCLEELKLKWSFPG